MIRERGLHSWLPTYLRETLPNYAACAQAIYDAGSKVIAQIYYSPQRGTQWLTPQ